MMTLLEEAEALNSWGLLLHSEYSKFFLIQRYKFHVTVPNYMISLENTVIFIYC